ncbi:hypothetical protein MUN82_11605 [Hymenobacter aerilatus]|uniref:Uncharacterized protein n=1 Tax=Hymenobacter aerilatus TaxID=2932251 RepID=A0A8T9SS66_9BACT|nr:hypothetical protein [Hymenobacter aerilatus]UOR03593.1 hypothetical protein MUN82_11605 [Hymenobacter aerilatus]
MSVSFLRFSGFSALLLVAACTSNKNLEQDSPQVSAEAVAPTLPAAPSKAKAPRLAQLDTTHFSPRFVRSFQETNKAETSFDVHGSWLLLSPTDSVAFPVAELPANAPVVYAATEKGRAYRLTLTRRNYSTVHYVAEARQGSKLLSRQTGLADLNPSFFADIEIPKDSETGLPFSAYEFQAATPQQQGFAVLIGRSQDADKAQIYGGTQPQQNAWHNVPTLRRQ